MYYIVFDLEFNIPYKIDPQTKLLKKGDSNPLMPIEILEIGAIKLNDKLEIIDTFEMLIKPYLYKRINPTTKKITKITKDYLQNALPFQQVIKKFFNWCGNNTIFCSWGKDDIIILENNCNFYKVNMPDINGFINIQTIFIEGEKELKLIEVVKKYNIEQDKLFHFAINDAYYTARLLQKIEKEQLYQYKQKIEDINKYEKIKSLDDERIDKEEIICICPQCGYIAETIKDWTFYKKYFWSIRKCNKCQKILYYKLKIMINNSENNELIYKMNVKTGELKSDVKDRG